MRTVLIAAGLALLAFLLWRLSSVLLLAFGAALLATLLRAICDFIKRHAWLSDKVAYGCSILILVAAAGGTGWLFGAQLSSQVDVLAERLPAALDSLEAWLRQQPWLQPLVAELRTKGGSIASHLGSMALTGVDALIGLMLVVFGGVYFGAEPRLYRDGIVALFPARQQHRAAEALDVGAYAMRRWLLSQLVDMAAVGALTGAGLWLAGVPSALALGVLSALASFVPYVGALAAGALAVVVAFGESGTLALWALGIYILVQQIEGQLIIPFVQRWAIAVPPALALFAVVALGYVFGPLGVLFATPLAVVLYALVKVLYVRDTLGREVSIAPL